jgi:hypothetical protein
MVDACCPELRACLGANDVCSEGGPDGDGELVCMRIAVVDAIGPDNVPTAEELNEALAACQTESCDVISQHTLDAADCMTAFCPVECY